MADNIPYSIAIPETYEKDGGKNQTLELSLDPDLENEMKCRPPETKHDPDDITGTAYPPFIHKLSLPSALCNEKTFYPKSKLHHAAAVGCLQISAENDVSSEALIDGDPDQPIRKRNPFGQS